MKPRIHPVEISIFPLNIVTVTSTKIMNRAGKNWAFIENKVLLKSKFQKKSIKVGLLVQHSSNKLFLKRFKQCSTLKNDIENPTFQIFQEVVHNFGRSDII